MVNWGDKDNALGVCMSHKALGSGLWLGLLDAMIISAYFHRCRFC